ncbi:DUF4260 domain-containing protein [Flavobacterium sp. J27]|uniref:DUF4260 domain-containing protein n=1 Tax=Flavobacterium sp. J27 TaxID=2060419 RepID=UPI00102F3D53|nr:DUF4260 domain-containing protein [Flavobacterium sp. J27]
MKTMLKLEEIGLFFYCMSLFAQLPYAWWWFPILLLVPDIGMLGYLFNTKLGAFTYNIFHHRIIAIFTLLTGIYLTNPIIQFTGIILLAHISFDRILGYGLKYQDSFHHTHLGNIGKT